MNQRDSLVQIVAAANPKSYAALVKSDPLVYKWLIEQKQLLNTANINETIWCIVNQCSPPLCKCGAPRQFNTYRLGYRVYCHSKCSARRQDHSARIKEVWQDQYKLEAMLEKKTQTNINRYGVDNAAKNSQVQEKIKQTNINRYGTATAINASCVVERIKKTNLEKYGVEWPFQSPEIMQKAHQSFKDNHPHVSDQMALARAAYVKKHGVNPFATEKVKQKIKITRQEKYGYLHYQQHHLPSYVIDILEDVDQFKSQLAGLTL